MMLSRSTINTPGLSLLSRYSIWRSLLAAVAVQQSVKAKYAQYRAGHLRRANIFVDDEIPFDVSQYADTNVFHDMLSDDNDKLHPISEKLWNKSKELVKKPSGEAEWTEALHAAIDEMRIEGIEVVHWREDLKPPVHNPRSTIPRKRNQSHQTLHETTADGTVYPSPHSLRAVEQQTIPIFKLKDPRPDICIGLSDNYLAKALEPSKGRSTARSFLYDLQDTSTLISDPHLTPLGLRFPFLIVEAKAGATGGNLYQAQNQAAVAGSTAVQIFETLSDLHCAQTLDQEYAGNIEGSNISVQHPTGVMLHLAFSITTEGPIHELMTMNNIIAIGSENVRSAAAAAWSQIRSYAVSLPEPQKGRATGFLPSELCYNAINAAVKEYPEKVASYQQPRSIQSSRKGGVVYFPGQPKIADTLTIMIPIHIEGEVTLDGIEVDMDHYYHILKESTLRIPDDGKLYALVVDRIIT
ncbi:hypothetical protein CNMCM8980_003210 [Aspergillus fumigatiaffinis]|nr:hypothetical protein CNMCM8980_003210 [Aspergillus fumigatiaffinis]